MKTKKKVPKIGFGMLDFVSVSLAAASGRLDMDTFSRYLGAMHPRKAKKPRKSKRKERT